MKVVEIFESIDGEGIRVGFPVTFIRLYGCNLKCSYCDSRYACEGDNYQNLAIEDILSKVHELGHQLITLTGGEPLIHKDVQFLISALIAEGYKVNIETDGAVDISSVCKKRQIIITLDYKCPSSGMENRMILENLDLLRKQDVLKFVVGSDADLEKAKEIIINHNLEYKCNIYFSPVFGSIDPKRIVEFILAERLDGVRMQLQIHKFIWSPDTKGV